MAVPDLAMAPLSDFRIQWVNGRRMLRFTAMMVNLGPGHFELRGGRASTAEPMAMRQVIYQTADRNGPIAQELPTAAVAQYSGDGHNHWHVMEMMRYDLWDGYNVVRGAKVGFCFLDSDRYFGSSGSYYRGSWCETSPSVLSNRMGISVGWGDEYTWDLAWQWVDITDMPSGTFVLRAKVDPYGFFLETDESNQCTIAQLSWTANSSLVTF